MRNTSSLFVFLIQGECWGSLRGHLDYAKHGKAETCVHGETREEWGRCTKDDVACTGEALTNYVYRIAPTGNLFTQKFHFEVDEAPMALISGSTSK